MGRRKAPVRTQRTHLVVVQDRSGSMSDKVAATISGYNEYIDTLKDSAEGEVFVTLTQFDDTFNDVYVARDLNTVPKLTTRTYVIGGMTALYDAVGKSIRHIENKVVGSDRVLMVIMTDGGENTSREYTHGAILNLLRQKREKGWEFVFLGAGEEAWNAGVSLGFNQNTSINYGILDAHDHSTGYGIMAAASASFTSGNSTSDYLRSSPIKRRLEDKAKKEQGTGNIGQTPGISVSPPTSSINATP